MQEAFDRPEGGSHFSGETSPSALATWVAGPQASSPRGSQVGRTARTCAGGSLSCLRLPFFCGAVSFRVMKALHPDVGQRRAGLRLGVGTNQQLTW